MTNKPKASDDPGIQRLRAQIDDLRFKISLALDDDPTRAHELDDLKQQIDALNQEIIGRIRELAAKAGSTSRY